MMTKPKKLKKLRKLVQVEPSSSDLSPLSDVKQPRPSKRPRDEITRAQTIPERAIPVIQQKNNDIDDLFQALKTSKKQKQEQELDRSAAEKRAQIDRKETKKASQKKSLISRPMIVNPEAPIERIDKETGYPVYKAHLLKVGEGGGTPLCPFDCNCCF